MLTVLIVFVESYFKITKEYHILSSVLSNVAFASINISSPSVPGPNFVSISVYNKYQLVVEMEFVIFHFFQNQEAQRMGFRARDYHFMSTLLKFVSSN